MPLSDLPPPDPSTYAELYQWIRKTLAPLATITKASDTKEAGHIHTLPQLEQSQLNTEARWLYEGLTGQSWQTALTQTDKTVPSEILAKAQQLLKSRCQERVPVQYLLKEAHFFGLGFKVSPAVLIPRPETELLVEEALDWIKRHYSASNTGPLRIIDLGTGSGCIPIALYTHLPEAIRQKTTLVATDLSTEALAIAKTNAKTHQVPIDFRQGHWWDCIAEKETFSVILSNPPYITPPHIDPAEQALMSPEVLLSEPSTALFTPQEPIETYRELLLHAKTHWQQPGLIAFEIGHLLKSPLERLCKELDFSQFQVRQDLGGKDRLLVISGASRNS